MKTTKYIFKLQKIDFINIKQYLERKGWRVIQYNVHSGDEVIKEFNLENLAKRTDGFIYDVGWVKYVFINSKLSDKDKIIVALHETGHIVLGQDLTQKDNKLNELLAWKFAYDVFYRKRIFAKRLVACIVCAALTLGAHCAFLKAEKSVNETNVYVTSSGQKYHTADCYYIKNRQTTRLDKSEAVNNYEPCKICIGEN